jgi:hypothetical protein
MELRGERVHAARRGLLRDGHRGPRPPNNHRLLRGRREVCAGQDPANPNHDYVVAWLSSADLSDPGIPGKC